MPTAHSNLPIIHSFIPDIYIAPLQETYSEALSVQRSARYQCYGMHVA